MNQEEQKKSKLQYLFLLLLLLGLLFLGAGIWNFWTSGSGSEYNHMEIDLNAERIEVDDGDSQSGLVYVEVGTDVTVDISDDAVYLHYSNPETNHIDARVSVMLDEQLVAQSGLVESGFYLDKIDGLLTDNLDYGTYEGALVVDTYDVETGERLLVNNEIAVTIQVVG